MLRSWLKSWYFRLPVVRELRQIRAALQVRSERSAETIRLLDLELEGHPRYSDPRRLQRSSFQVCSQNGEDGVIHEIFRRIGPTDRIFAEIGIGDGSENNTAFLLSQGWTGFWFDGSDNVLRTIADRPDLRNGCVKTRIAFITRENVARLFAELAVPKEFDLLSLDIDQNTYYAWESLGEYRPRVVVVEYNASLPADVEWKVRYDAKRTWDGSHNFGASLKAFETLGRSLGYSLVGCEFIGSNAFFVRDDLVGDKFATPFTAENHYEPPRYALLNRRGHAAAILDRAA